MHKGLCGAGVVRKHPPTWRLFDATGQRVGRLAQTLSKLLIGKHKPTFRPNIDNGDVCVVINAEKVEFTGKKWQFKKYYRHSGQPGNLKVKTARQMVETKPEELIRHAVKGMLPRNNTRPFRLERLIVCAGPYHPFGLEFAPPEKVPSRDDDSRRGEKTHRFAFEQKPKGPIFWKGFMKYKYSKDERKKAWEEYRRANGD